MDHRVGIQAADRKDLGFCLNRITTVRIEEGKLMVEVITEMLNFWASGVTADRSWEMRPVHAGQLVCMATPI